MPRIVNNRISPSQILVKSSWVENGPKVRGPRVVVLNINN